MSIVTIDLALNRIKIASAESPIALFASDKPGHVQAVFGQTVATLNLIRSQPDIYIGTYSREVDREDILEAIRKCKYFIRQEKVRHDAQAQKDECHFSAP